MPANTPPTKEAKEALTYDLIHSPAGLDVSKTLPQNQGLSKPAVQVRVVDAEQNTHEAVAALGSPLYMVPDPNLIYSRGEIITRFDRAVGYPLHTFRTNSTTEAGIIANSVCGSLREAMKRDRTLQEQVPSNLLNTGIWYGLQAIVARISTREFPISIGSLTAGAITVADEISEVLEKTTEYATFYTHALATVLAFVNLNASQQVALLDSYAAVLSMVNMQTLREFLPKQSANILVTLPPVQTKYKIAQEHGSDVIVGNDTTRKALISGELQRLELLFRDLQNPACTTWSIALQNQHATLEPLLHFSTVLEEVLHSDLIRVFQETAQFRMLNSREGLPFTYTRETRPYQMRVVLHSYEVFRELANSNNTYHLVFPWYWTEPAFLPDTYSYFSYHQTAPNFGDKGISFCEEARDTANVILTALERQHTMTIPESFMQPGMWAALRYMSRTMHSWDKFTPENITEEIEQGIIRFTEWAQRSFEDDHSDLFETTVVALRILKEQTPEQQVLLLNTFSDVLSLLSTGNMRYMLESMTPDADHEIHVFFPRIGEILQWSEAEHMYKTISASEKAFALNNAYLRWLTYPQDQEENLWSNAGATQNESLLAYAEKIAQAIQAYEAQDTPVIVRPEITQADAPLPQSAKAPSGRGFFRKLWDGDVDVTINLPLLGQIRRVVGDLWNGDVELPIGKQKPDPEPPRELFDRVEGDDSDRPEINL